MARFVADEFGRVFVVGVDAPTLAAGQEDVIGFSCRKKASTAAWSGQVSSAWVRVRRLAWPLPRRLRMRAEPTRPRCAGDKYKCR